MKKILLSVLVILGMTIAACSGAAATQPVAPSTTVASPTQPSETPEIVATEEVVSTPTNIVGTNKVYLVDGDKPDQSKASVAFFTTNLNRFACPKGECEADENIAKLTGGDQVSVVLQYDFVSGRYEIAVLPEGEFVKIKVNNSIVVLYNADNTYLSIPFVPIKAGIATVNQSFSKLISDTKELMDAGKACIGSGARFGEVFECRNMPTLTPSPTPTASTTPTSTRTPRPSPTPTNTKLPTSTATNTGG